MGRLSRRSQQTMTRIPTGAEVLAIAAWDGSGSAAEYRKYLQRSQWEVVVPELIFAHDRERM